MGGIVGYGRYDNAIENCVNYVNITAKSMNSNSQIGSIVGELKYSSTLSNCYWSDEITFDALRVTSRVMIFNVVKFNNDFVLNESVSAKDYQGTSLIDALNAYSNYYDLYDYPKWILNKDGNPVSFKINNYKGFTLNSKIILLPNPVIEGKLWFDGWYTDSSCTTKLAENEVTEATNLHGKWEENNNEYTISFDTRGGSSVDQIRARFNSIVSLPNNPVRGDCVFGYWKNKCGDRVEWNYTVLAHDLTLTAVWLCHRITSSEDLIDLSKLVNSGTRYDNKETFFLDSDIDFTDELSRQFKPIGNSDNSFSGTFDGQGHVIRNLKLVSSLDYVGLFGHTNYYTTRNIVLDDSCSISSSYSSDIGGIVGYCQLFCDIKNNVNMASLTYDGGEKYSPTLGGIAGLIYVFSFEAIVKNCVNYGAITINEKMSGSIIGGIVGYSWGFSTSMVSIQNCLNYGTITYNGMSSGSFEIGGIAGSGEYLSVTNCLSAGSIITDNTTGDIGTIMGASSDSYSVIIGSFWTSDVGFTKACGSGNPYTDSETKESEVNSELAEKLNTYAARNNTRNKWVLNTNGASATFKAGNSRGFTLKSEVFILPNFTEKYNHYFNGWYNDEALTSPFTESDIVSDITLYGRRTINQCTVSFDLDNGTIVNRTFNCGDPIVYPERVGYTIIGWYKDSDCYYKFYGTTATRDVTLYSEWDIIIYNVTFIGFDGVTLLSEIYDYGCTFNYPILIEEYGYTFVGWFEDSKFTIPFNDTFVTRSVTLYAKYDEIKASESSHGSFSIRAAPLFILALILLIF